jgi:DNA-binding response OmpR family regulator
MSDARTILLVDDDDDYATSISSFLTAHGFRVLRARNGREGLALARAQRPDLMLLDVMMEERTEGFFTLQQLRRDPEISELPVFVVSSIYTAVPGFRISPEASWLRQDEFLAKPVDLDGLLARIRSRLATACEPSRGLDPVTRS